MSSRLGQLQPVATTRYLWPFLRPDRRRLLDAAATSLALTGVEVLTPVLIGAFVDVLMAQLGDRVPRASSMAAQLPSLTQRDIIVLLVVGAVLRGFLLARQRALAGRIGERVAARIRNALWAHLQQLPLDQTRRRGTGRLMVRFLGDARAVQRLVTQGLVRVSQDLLVASAVLLTLVLLNWRLGLAVVLVVPAYAAIFWRLNPELQAASRRTRRRRSSMSGYLDQRILGMAAVKAFVRQRDETARLTELSRDLANRGARLAAAGGRLRGVAAAAVAVSMALVLALAAEEVGAGRATGGTLVAFFTLTGLLSPIFQRVADANRYLQEAEISVDRLAAFLELQPESPADETRPALRVRGGVVSVEGVSFSYADGTAALDNVSLQARRGELIALVGPNGAGKSTLLDLLLRFQQPTSGRITIDGQDIAEVSLTSLRSQIGLVSQDAPIFEATVRENVAYGVRGDVAEDRLERVARLTGVDRLVAELPEGWETKLGDRRRVLSRGERQRVAVARGLVSDPPIVVLDEATASLDAATEQALARVLRELARHKTVIVAAHRLPLVLAADRVYVLEDGRVVEEGTPASLAGWGGVYGRLFGASAATPGPTPRESDGRERPPGRDGGIGDDGSFSLAPCRPPHRGR